MEIEQQVVSVELAKKLKELGVKQEGLFVWIQKRPENVDEKEAWYLKQEGQWPVGMKLYNSVSAFTVAELGEALPDEIEVKEQSYWISMGKTLGDKWQVGYRVNGTSWIYFAQEADTEADARAKMLIYLLENKLAQFA